MNIDWKKEFKERFVVDPAGDINETNFRGRILPPYKLKTPEGGISEVIEFIELLIQSAITDKIDEIEKKLPEDYTPGGHDKNACINHEKYTSACCGCQKRRTRVETLDEIKEILKS